MATLQVLLAAKADGLGFTPLFHAETNGHVLAAQILREHLGTQ